MMRLYVLSNPADPECDQLFKIACEKADVGLVTVNAIKHDYSSAVRPAKGDALYRVDTSDAARALEHHWINEGIATFHTEWRNVFRQTSNRLSISLARTSGISIPETIDYIVRDRALLRSYVKSLGGFPVILKVLGGSHGIGVMRVDSPQSLFSVVDYLYGSGIHDIIMRKYIDVAKSARLIVIGDRVVDSIEYQAPKGDFRSNEGAKPNVVAKKFPVKVQRLAIDSVKALGFEFGGVDILVDKKGKAYMLEVNMPAYFPRAQNLTGTDIASLMVAHLVKKARAIK
jgi:glutathione synthase/RimK-type ligase-like ATP-grasp enzyme